jgi:hypothetical protein
MEWARPNAIVTGHQSKPVRGPSPPGNHSSTLGSQRPNRACPVLVPAGQSRLAPPAIFPTKAAAHCLTPCAPSLSFVRVHCRGEVLFLCANSPFPIMPLYSSPSATPCRCQAAEQKLSPGLRPHSPSSNLICALNPSHRPPHGRPDAVRFCQCEGLIMGSLCQPFPGPTDSSLSTTQSPASSMARQSSPSAAPPANNHQASPPNNLPLWSTSYGESFPFPLPQTESPTAGPALGPHLGHQPMGGWPT